MQPEDQPHTNQHFYPLKLIDFVLSTIKSFKFSNSDQISRERRIKVHIYSRGLNPETYCDDDPQKSGC